MKKVIMLFIAMLLVANSYSQILVSPEEWSSTTDTSAFDGVSRAALIIGTSNIGTPILSVNRTDDETLKVYLSYCPAGICGETFVTIKFDNDNELYVLPASFSFRYYRYTIQFNEKLTIDSFIKKLKTFEKFYIRMKSRCVLMDVEFTLEGAEAALEILN